LLVGTFRFFLALAVVVSHFGGLWGHVFMSGLIAVQCFYMVSGFLISLILTEKYNTATGSGLLLFYTNRALRIFVPYWTFMLLIVIAQMAIGLQLSLVQSWPEMEFLTHLYLLGANIFIIGQEWVMWLSYNAGAMTWTWGTDGRTPHLADFLVIPQAWSISLELMFYAIAPFLVKRHWLVLLAYIIAAEVGRKVMSTYGFSGSGFVYRFFPLELGLFFGGVLCHRIYEYLNDRRLLNLRTSLAIAATLIFMMFFLRYWTLWQSHRFHLLVLLALPALFHVSKNYAFDRWLGELSYPIYLCHLAVLSIGSIAAQRLFGSVNQDWLSLALICVTIAGAIFYVHLIDAPFERWRQRRVERSAERSPPAVAGSCAPFQSGPSRLRRRLS
jgi:peptidoglycan/LPS O-acetylase OafA/YrhL